LNKYAVKLRLYVFIYIRLHRLRPEHSIQREEPRPRPAALAVRLSPDSVRLAKFDASIARYPEAATTAYGRRLRPNSRDNPHMLHLK